MYKKIMLSLMFLFIFSSRESLSVEPIATTILTCGIVSVVSSVTTCVINKTIEIYNPSSDKRVSDAEACERLNFIDARIKFRQCVVDSKPESEKSIKGIPVRCKDVARTFLACGGKEEMIKMLVDLEEFDS